MLHFFFINTVLIKKKGDEEKLKEEILNLMFKDFDYNLREMGVGDLSVKKKIYQMSEAIAGRVKAYEEVKNKQENIIGKAIRRNLYGTLDEIDNFYLIKMIKYFKDSIKFVKSNKLLNINENDAIFLQLNKYF